MKERIEQAARQIERILCNLERETDTLVERINIRSIDLTSVGDTQPVYRQSVVIEMRRKVGHAWGVSG